MGQSLDCIQHDGPSCLASSLYQDSGNLLRYALEQGRSGSIEATRFPDRNRTHNLRDHLIAASHLRKPARSSLIECVFRFHLPASQFAGILNAQHKSPEEIRAIERTLESCPNRFLLFSRANPRKEPAASPIPHEDLQLQNRRRTRRRRIPRLPRLAPAPERLLKVPPHRKRSKTSLKSSNDHG